MFIEARGVRKTYQMGEVEVHALNGVDFEIEEGEFVVILGPSGSGKSTLLNAIGGMDLPSEGSIIVDGKQIDLMNEKQLTEYRRHTVGFVFQFYNLMANLTALENVELATEITTDALDIEDILKSVNLYDRRNHFPSQMSGGEQQRVAIARAVAKNPKILLCDEPTGALDFETGLSILELLVKINKEFKKTVIIITHNASIAKIGNRVIRMRSGQVLENIINENPVDPQGVDW
jgi:putative ABC transport system ATP-binding protein